MLGAKAEFKDLCSTFFSNGLTGFEYPLKIDESVLSLARRHNSGWSHPMTCIMTKSLVTIIMISTLFECFMPS